jgi:hypothetical protein
MHDAGRIFENPIALELEKEFLFGSSLTSTPPTTT